MAKNKMADLRDHLFETIEALKDTDKPMAAEVERAKAICGVARQIIDAAKTEVKFMEVAGGGTGEFFDGPKTSGPQLTNGNGVVKAR